MMALAQQANVIVRQKIGSDDKENEIIVQELVGRTINQLRSLVNCSSVVTSVDLKQQLKAHFDSALKEYFEFRDDPRQFDKFKFVLIGELKNAFKDFCLDHTNNCSAYLAEAGLTFRSEADTRINSKCLPLDNLNSVLGEVKAKVIQQYDGSTVTDMEQLIKRLDVEVEQYTSENNVRLAKLYNRYNSILEQLLQKYEFLVEMRLPDDELETATDQKLESTFNFCKKTVVTELNEKMQFDSPEIKSMFENRIVSAVGERFAEKVVLSKSHKEKKFAEVGEVINAAVGNFKNSLAQAFGKISNDHEIHNFRNSKMSELIMSVTDSIYDILPDRNDAKQMLELAKQKMQKAFDDLQGQRHAEAEKFQKLWESELNSICETFSQHFHELCQSEVLPNIDELNTERDILISELIGKLNWLNAHNHPELLESFRIAAKEQMTALSRPILEAHSKLLETNYQQQKLEMERCLEAYKMKLKDLLKAEQTDDVHINVKTLGDKTIDHFEVQVKLISPISPAATNILRDILKKEISRVQGQFEMDVKDRILVANAEISQLLTESVEDYKQLMGAFSIASNFSKEKIAQIHDKIKTRAMLNLQKSLRLVKFAGDRREQQVKLERMIDCAHSDAKATVENQLAEWNKKLESCAHKSKLHYKQLFNRDLGSAATTGDLNKLHEDFKEQSIAEWEESFPIHHFADKLLPERRRFSKQLDSEFRESVLPMWQKINSDIDQKTRNAVENIVKRYEEHMNSALAAMDYNAEETILLRHDQMSKEAMKHLNNVDKPKNINKKVYDDLLSSRLDSTLDCIRNQNAQRKETIRNDLWNNFLQKKNEIMRETSNWNVFPETPQLMGTCMNQLADRSDQFNRLKIPNHFKQELWSLAEEKLTEMLSELKLEWDNIQPDPNKLQLAINTAVVEYTKEMANRTTKSGQIFKDKAMKWHHVHSLQIVRKKFEETVKQTSRAQELFNEAVEGVLRKFEDLNDIRAAEHSEATVGIDLGTTFSCVAIYKGDKIEMIPDREHHSNTVPSYVFYESATKTVVGHSAKDQSVIYPQTTIFDSKRLIGRRFNDPQTQKDITQWPFKVIRDPDFNRKEPKIEVHGKTFHPEEVSAEILKHLRKNAELYLGRVVTDVVITVPAYFNDAQKRATKNAAALANINVLEIINEPTSAAIAYSLNYTDGKNKNILVFDLGGGTFDVSVLSTEKCNIQVKAVGGDNHLGGEDFDSNMVDFCIEKFRQSTGLTIPKNVSRNTLTAVAASTADSDEEVEEETRKVFETLRRLRQKCEMAKINLSKTDKVRVVVDYIYDQKNMDVEITVEDFNEINQHLFDKCIRIVSDTVKEAKLSKAEIDDVVLVGGSSRIPEVQRLLSEFFDGKSLIMTLNPDEVVAQGAAYRAAMISGSKSRLLNEIKFRDVNPLSLGIEVVGERFSTILPKNTPLPAKRTRTYVTTRDYQTEIKVSIYEGEDAKIKNNNLLGEFTLSGIPSKRQGKEPVDVTIECDDEGLIHVTAKVQSNDSSEEIKIQSNRGGLTEEDIKNAISRNST